MNHATRISMMEKVRQLLGSNPPRVQAAALPWRRKNGDVEVILITSRDTGRWVLPKGWPEKREALSETAAREAAEEAGVKGKADRAAIGRYFYDKETSTGVQWRCEVAVFPLHVASEAKNWPEKKERTRRWLSPEEAGRLVREPDLAELIAGFTENPTEKAG